MNLKLKSMAVFSSFIDTMASAMHAWHRIRKTQGYPWACPYKCTKYETDLDPTE